MLKFFLFFFGKACILEINIFILGKLINYLIAMRVLVAFFVLFVLALIGAPVFAAASSGIDVNNTFSFSLVLLSLFLASVYRKRISFKNLRNLSIDTREYIRRFLPTGTPRLIGFFEWDADNGYRFFEYFILDPSFKRMGYETLYKETVAFFNERGIKTRLRNFEIPHYLIDENNNVNRNYVYELMFKNLVYINYIDHIACEEQVCKYEIIAVSLFHPHGEPPMVIPLRDIYDDGFIPVAY
jgi:hypothetical protein